MNVGGLRVGGGGGNQVVQGVRGEVGLTLSCLTAATLETSTFC